VAWPLRNSPEGKSPVANGTVPAAEDRVRHLEALFNSVWLLIGVAVCATSFSLGIVGPSGPESGFFPLLSGIAIAGGAALLLVQPAHVRVELEPFLPEGASGGRVLLVLLTMAGMVAALPWIGFNLSGFVGMPLLIRTVGRPGWLFSVLFGVGSTLVVFYVFNTWLGMSLPRGLLGF
jgi:putative tricarboxylic transport membrane protein